MNIYKLLFSEILRNPKKQLPLVVGVALAAAVLSASLITAGSIEKTLQKKMIDRIGKTEILLHKGGAVFSSSFKTYLNQIPYTNKQISSILLASGEILVNNYKEKVQIIYYDDNFFKFSTRANSKQRGGVGVNDILANKIKKKGEFPFETNSSNLLVVTTFLPSTLPNDLAFNEEEDSKITLSVTPRFIVGSAEMGNFGISKDQIEPATLYLPLELLDKNEKYNGKITHLLLSGVKKGDAQNILTNHLKLDDLGFSLIERNDLKKSSFLSLVPEDLFFNEKEYKILEIPNRESYLGYLINSIVSKSGTIPHSIAIGSTALPLLSNQIALNQYAANKINAKIGTEITLTYYVPGPLRTYKETNTQFTVAQILPMDHPLCDREFMPLFPGFYNAESCREWNPGIPIDLDKIDKSEEEYWEQYRGTPKVVISYESAVRLWKEVGVASHLRFPLSEREKLEGRVPPLFAEAGFIFDETLKDGVKGAGKASDLRTLFLSLSFIVIITALLLHIELCNIYLDEKKSYIQLLTSLGFTRKRISSILFRLFLILIGFGALVGSLAGVPFTRLLLLLLDLLWPASFKSGYQIFIAAPNIVLPFVLLLISGFLLATWSLKNVSPKMGERAPDARVGGPTTSLRWISKKMGLFVIAILLIVSIVLLAISNPLSNLYGGLTLILFLILSFLKLALFLREKSISLKTLIVSGLTFDLRRTFFQIVPIATAIFLIYAILVHRVLPPTNLYKNDSGTGGTKWTLTTLSPIPYDLNLAENRERFGLSYTGDQKIFSCRQISYEDISCLNLNKVDTPSLLGVPAKLLGEKQLFTFRTKKEVGNTGGITASSSARGNHWFQLTNSLEDGTIPAAIDESPLTWSLQKKVGDTLEYKSESGKKITFRIVEVLADSLFQGNLLIDREILRTHFPSATGNNLFLFPVGDKSITDHKSLERAFSKYGATAVSSAERWFSFKGVANSYLAVFFTLAATALLISFGGALVLIQKKMDADNYLFPLLTALGFSSKRVLFFALFHFGGAVIFGIIVGFFTGSFVSFQYFSELRVLILFATLFATLLLIYTVLQILHSVDRNSPLTSLKNKY